MIILSSLLFSISANVDNFVVGLSYGIKGIKIGGLSNLIISLVTFAGTILSMLFSKFIIRFIPRHVTSIIGSIILIAIGGWTIIGPLLKNTNDKGILNNPEKADKDKSLHIDSKESITLALALSLNNIGLGVGASMAGLNIVTTSLLTLVFSLIMIRIGYILGEVYLSNRFSEKATLVSGILIVLLGVGELLK